MIRSPPRSNRSDTLFPSTTLFRSHDGYYIAPARVAETTAKMRVNQEEIFGPVATVLRVADYEEALAIANDVEFGLSAGIVTSSLRHAHDFMARAQAGM